MLEDSRSIPRRITQHPLSGMGGQLGSPAASNACGFAERRKHLIDFIPILYFIRGKEKSLRRRWRRAGKLPSRFSGADKYAALMQMTQRKMTENFSSVRFRELWDGSSDGSNATLLPCGQIEGFRRGSSPLRVSAEQNSRRSLRHFSTPLRIP